MDVAARKQHHGSLTYRDLWHTPEDGNRYEIIEGELHTEQETRPVCDEARH